MAKTVLEIVQDVLNETNGDNVNSISDTEESEQVARTLKQVYEDLVSHTNWPHTLRLAQLVSYADSNFPTHMRLPANVKRIVSVSYDKRKVSETKRAYREVQYLDPDMFLHKLNVRDSTSDDVRTVVDTSGIELLIYTNKAPDYYTSIDDTTLIFDSYDSEVESTLTVSKVQLMGYIIPAFTVSDTFVPDIPVDAFSLVLNETISRCQFRQRQIQDAKAEQEASRQSRFLSRQSWRVNGGIKFPDYGRKH